MYRFLSIPNDQTENRNRRPPLFASVQPTVAFSDQCDANESVLLLSFVVIFIPVTLSMTYHAFVLADCCPILFLTAPYMYVVVNVK